jgi:hypothetical protein
MHRYPVLVVGHLTVAAALTLIATLLQITAATIMAIMVPLCGLPFLIIFDCGVPSQAPVSKKQNIQPPPHTP